MEKPHFMIDSLGIYAINLFLCIQKLQITMNMATVALNKESGLSLGNVYMNMMRHLSDATKLEIINLLSASILHKDNLQVNSNVKEEMDLYSCFQGEWGNGMKTEDYCNELRRDLMPSKDIEL